MGEQSKSDELRGVLFHACLLGRADIVKNAISSFTTACNYSDSQVADALSLPREDGATLLHIASSLGHVDVVRALVTAGANMSSKPSRGDFAGRTTFEVANPSSRQAFIVMLFEQIAMGNIAIINSILDSGVDVNVKDGSGSDESLLHWACSFGNVEVVKLLIARGCDVNIKNSLGETPLHLAVKHGFLEIAHLLKAGGASVWSEDNQGRRPIDCIPTTCQESIRTEISTLLSTPSHPPPDMSRGTSGSVDDVEASVVDVNCASENSLAELPAAEPEPLFFWPPVQLQRRKPNSASPLLLRTDENLLICVANNEVDMFPVLTSSGFLDCMDAHGFQVQVKRTALGAKFRLCIDSNVCPNRHSYHIVCDQGQLELIAADYSGLYYGMYTLIQLIQVHSSITVDGAVHLISIPSIEIIDFPNIPQRGIYWTFCRAARLQAQSMKDCIELLSRLRINMLFLQVDCASSDGHQEEEDGRESSSRPTESVSTRIYSMDEDCRRRCIELVPTVVITSTNHRLPLDILKNFSHSMIVLILDFSAPTGGDNSEFVDECRQVLKTLLKDAQLAGFGTIQTSSSAWTRSHVHPKEVARQVGVAITESDLAILHHPQLFLRPILAMEDYIDHVVDYVVKANASLRSFAVLPGFVESDFWFPMIVLKYYFFVFSGLAWNCAATRSIVGTSESMHLHSSKLKDMLKLLVFPGHRAVRRVQMDCLLTLFTNDGKFSGAPDSPYASDSCSVFALNERYLLKLVSMDLEDVSAGLALLDSSSLQSSHKIYRRVLIDSEWKPRHNIDPQPMGKSLMEFLGVRSSALGAEHGDDYNRLGDAGVLAMEIEELFSFLNILSVTCRVLTQATAAFKRISKVPSNQSVALLAMIEGIPIGLRSDLANSLLESLSGFSHIWKQRFDRNLLDHLRHSASAKLAQFSQSAAENISRVEGKHSLSPRSLTLPVMALFHSLCFNLSVSQSLKDYIERILA